MGVIVVSIIVCTYNDSEFLYRALSSCLLQNIEKEIILVDDCSTKPFDQEALNLIIENKDAIRVIRHEKNMGLSAARNTGIAASKYEFVITLDADDFFFPRSLRTLAYYIEKDFDIFYGYMTSSGRVVKPYIGEITKEVLLSHNPIFCSSLYRRSLWDKVSGYKVRKGAHYEDWNFWCRCFMVGAKFKYLPTLVYEHTERPNSMLRTLESNKEYFVTVATEVLRGVS